MTPRIVNLEEKRLIGQHTTMSLIDNKTGFLWRQFAPRIKEIALGSPERMIDKENEIYGLGMMKAENIKWIRPSVPTPQNAWRDVVVVNLSSGGNE